MLSEANRKARERAASSAGAAGSAPVWNYWLAASDDIGAVPQPAIGELKLNSRQRLHFRLSASDLAKLYPVLGSLGSTPELAAAIKDGLRDESRSELLLHVLIQSIDPGRLRIDDESRQQTLRIDLESLRQRSRVPAPTNEAGDDAKQDWLALSRLAQFTICFTVIAPGSHDIGIAIVDASSGYPLQTMIAKVSADAEWPSNVTVAATGQTLFSSRSAPFDLSLYLYDLSSTDTTGSERYLHAQLGWRDAATQHYEFVAWQTDVSLPGLVDQVAAINTAQGVEADDQNLRDAGLSLGRSLFEPRPASREDDEATKAASQTNLEAAARARQWIQTTARYAADSLPPSMVVVIISPPANARTRFASVVLPVGAIGVADPQDAQNEPVFLGERFAMALAIPDQSVSISEACPSAWYVAIPDGTFESSGPLSDALKALKAVKPNWLTAPGVHRQPASLQPLRDWLDPGNTNSEQSFVFTYLGHHDNGALYLTNGGRKIFRGNLRRNFGGSSIAILNACTSAMDHVSDGTPVGRLAQLGVAATVATTSAVSGNLAAAYMDCLSAVLAKRSELTIGQAHALSTQCLWAGSPAAASGKRYRYGGAALKYVLIGNPYQRICAATTKADPR